MGPGSPCDGSVDPSPRRVRRRRRSRTPGGPRRAAPGGPGGGRDGRARGGPGLQTVLNRPGGPCCDRLSAHGASLVRSATARGTVQPLTESDIRSSFVNATPDELAQLPIPGLHETLWNEREFLGWRDPQAARRGYMVSWMDGKPVGIVVRAAGGSLRAGIAAMCSFCHSPQPATQVRLFSAARAGESGRNGNTIGTYLCEDLGCPMLIRTAPPHLNPPATIAMRSESLLQRLHNFTADLLTTE
ncbi:hypothetical protein DEJ33_08930 [Curtobacterium sp. MCPF17_047]|nr:hypothetical protein DEJ33_08930 [Curtobacterium sp. MCPF17_047]